MPIAQSLADFQANVTQCDNLIANAHQVDANQVHLLPPRDREQITVAAFLNLFISWEEYVEAALNDFMMGEPTTNGTQPVKYVNPTTREHSQKMVVHTHKYFDFANHENVRRLAKIYFDNGYPFETPMSSIISDLSDLKTMRNACAHLSSSTKAALEALANRILGQPQPGITIYRFLTMNHPNVANGTIYATYRDKLLVAAGLIAQG